MWSAVRKFGCVVAAICLGAGGSALAAGTREVKDPHYGEVLFHFYQENYFSALTQVMTAQHFGRLPQQGDEAELLRGGMLLSYGLHLEAGRIFQALIDAGAPPAVRDRAWFFLAKIRYQRGYIAEAMDAMGRIGGVLPPEIEDERRVLHAYLLMQQRQYADAVAALRQVSARSDWAVYGRYNLGVALVQAGEQADGLALLDEIGRDAKLRKRQEELAALSDKANVALGFVYLRNESPVWAKVYLDRVRLDGLMSNKALLGLGWAHAAQDEHEFALVPWTELTGRAAHDTAVQEALLAVPYSLGKLGAYRQSLAKYEQALDTYTRELGQLDESMRAIRGGALVENILRSNPGEESGWFWRVRQVPDSPESRYLSELLAGNAFQEGLKNYRDVGFLIRNLDEWARNIQVFHDVVATRRQAHAERLPRVVAGDRGRDLERARASERQFRDSLTRIEETADDAALANDAERGLLERLARVQSASSRLADAAAREAAQEKHRLLSGLMTWDLSAQAPERLWQVKKGLNDTARLLDEAEGHRAALARAQTELPARFDGMAQRIDGMRSRIASLQAALRREALAQEQFLADLAVEELSRRREQIAAYITQAQFAVAQIYDQALRTPTAEKTP
jgi:hypothetical protein